MSSREIKAVIFDLDGTLLDTLEDLAAAVNYALKQMGYPERTIEEVRRFVGNGVAKLMKRAVPVGTTKEDMEKTLLSFKEYYTAHSKDRTRLYEGVEKMLLRLQKNGIKMAIVSNKLHPAVQILRDTYFSGIIEVAIGEQEDKGVRKKPAPDTVLQALSLLSCTKEEAVYVGDSDVDIETAKNCGMPCVSVTWGFRSREFLISHGATEIIDNPEDIFPYLEIRK